jgi:hypothetical protein
MFSTASGEVIGIISEHPEIQELWVRIDNKSQPERAYNYLAFNQRVETGARVFLNTSAVNLGLGTGGRHFVIPDPLTMVTPPPSGHIMKLRYTPWQFPVLAAEEEASPYHGQLEESFSLEGVPVVAAPLHSMLPGIILGFRSVLKFTPKIAYVMTDGAALPIALSELVRELKRQKLLDLTITAGHAFGGDLEAVSIPSALVTARQVLKADLIIVALGPGIVGTGTKLGFSGVEQSWVIDLATRLQGVPVLAPRISGADPRERHQVISHHSLTVLKLASHPALLALSRLIPRELADNIMSKLSQEDLGSGHHWFLTDDSPAEDLFEEYGISVKSMGRGVKEDPWFFQSSVAAGFLAAMVASGQLSSLTRWMR